MKLGKGLIDLQHDSGVGTYLTKLEDMCIEQKTQIEDMKNTFRYVIDDLAIRANLDGDDSLNIGQGVLDKMHSFIKAS